MKLFWMWVGAVAAQVLIAWFDGSTHDAVRAVVWQGVAFLSVGLDGGLAARRREGRRP